MTIRLVRTRSDAVLRARPDRAYVFTTIVYSLARALVIFFIAIPLTLLLPDALLLVMLSLLVASGITFGILAYLLATDVEFMAFKDGYFKGHLGLLHLIRGTARITPWDMIEEVCVMKDRAGVTRLTIMQKDGETMVIDRTPDTLEVLRCLKQHVPDRVHRNVDIYLIENPGFVFHVEEGSFLRSTTNTRLRLSFVIILAAYVMLCALTTRQVYMTADAPAALGAAMAFIAAGWLGIASMLGKTLPMCMLWDAKPYAKSEIAVPLLVFPRFFLSLRTKVPVSKILAVRRKLHSYNGIHDHSQVRLADGRWYDTNIDVFIWALDKQGFLRKGDMAVNPNAVPDTGFCLARFGPGRAMASVAGILTVSVGSAAIVLQAMM